MTADSLAHAFERAGFDVRRWPRHLHVRWRAVPLHAERENFGAFAGALSVVPRDEVVDLWYTPHGGPHWSREVPAEGAVDQVRRFRDRSAREPSDDWSITPPGIKPGFMTALRTLTGEPRRSSGRACEADWFAHRAFLSRWPLPEPARTLFENLDELIVGLLQTDADASLHDLQTATGRARLQRAASGLLIELERIATETEPTTLERAFDHAETAP